MDISREHFPRIGFPQHGSGEMYRGIRTPQLQKGVTPGKGDEDPVREPMVIILDRSQKRKMKSDPIERLRNSLDFTHGAL